MSAGCPISVENVWGPTVARSCLQGFDFTLFFEETILSILPLGLAICLVPLRLRTLRTSRIKVVASSRLHICKLISYALYIILQLVLLGLWSTTAPRTNATLATVILTIVAFILFAYLSYVEHELSLRPSTLLNICLGFTVLLDIARARTLWFVLDSRTVAVVFLVAYLLKLLLLVLEVTEKRSLFKPSFVNVSPEATSGVLNRGLFIWINPLLLRGFRTLLSIKTLPLIDEALTASSNQPKLVQRWERANKDWKHALLWTFACHYKWTIFAGFAPKTAWIGFSFAQPFLVERVLNFMTEPDGPNTMNIAYGLIGAYALTYCGIAISYVFYQHKTDQLIIQFRGSLVTFIFSKTLRMSSTAVSDASALTLMSADIDRIGNGLRQLHDTWSAIIEIPVAIWLLERLLGVAVVAPALFLALLLGLGIPLANAAGNFQNDWLEAIEERLAVTSKALGVMKGIKMIGAADVLSNIVTTLRESEIRASGFYRLYTTFVLTISFASEAFAPVVGFGTYIILAERRGTATLTEGVAFAALTLFSLLDRPMVTLVDGVEELKTVVNCFERIQEHIEGVERQDYRQIIGSASDSSTTSPATSTRQGHEGTSSATEMVDFGEKFASRVSTDYMVQVRNASAAWSEESDPVLNNLNLEIKSERITMISGPVGSGKSTLLRLLMGEIPFPRGSVTTAFRDAAYCSQSPWIRNGSIQQNILGVSVWDESRYRKVVTACNLSTDFSELPDGDQTKVGARGSRLSGGQQTRIAFARALYAPHSILILDDVLTGLDRRTEANILEAVFGASGLLKNWDRRAIMATNSSHHLSYADHIVVLDENGRIADQGTLDKLSRTNEYIQRLASQPRVVTAPKPPEMQPTEEQLEDLELPDDDAAVDQARRTGDLKIYLYYFQTAGWSVIALYMLTAAGFTFGTTFPTVWLQWWTNANAEHGTQRVGYWLGVYAGLGALTMLSTFASSFVLLMIMVPTTARRFHRYLLNTTVHATTSFLTSTDVGSTTNRFSQDLELIDLDLPQVFETSILSLLGAIVEAVLVFIGSGYVAIAVPAVILVVYFIQNFYLRTSRQLRFLDIEAKAPLFSHFLEVLGGLTSVRAYGWGPHYEQHNRNVLNESQKPYYLLFSVQRWLTLVLNLVVAGIAILLVAIVTTRRNSATSLLGVALFNVVSFGSSLEQLVTEWTQLEQSIGAVARIKAYVTTTPAEDLKTEVEDVPPNWPKSGSIEFHNVVASYETSEEPVLKTINLRIQPGEKIAICGRTGSGKSSLASTLLRMLELDSGTIEVDGIDITTIPRSTVRARLNTLPQETFFLYGSVRLNLDPQALVTDDATLVESLTAVGLWAIFEEKGGLDEDLDEDVLSHGQRQLFCLARAMCKPGCVLILDEATSSVDADTEQVMNRLIRDRFTQWTIIAIAHKLQSVLDFDKVVLLDRGRVVEFDSPRRLLGLEGSQFRALYESMGQSADG